MDAKSPIMGEFLWDATVVLRLPEHAAVKWNGRILRLPALFPVFESLCSLGSSRGRNAW